jgi:hypothetical protein
MIVPRWARWPNTRRHKTTQELWERYVIGPEASADPAAWRTELSRQLVEE